jgi:hypothetical protein
MVMIDGRQTFLSARDLRNLLESMPAENLRTLRSLLIPHLNTMRKVPQAFSTST